MVVVWLSDNCWSRSIYCRSDWVSTSVSDVRRFDSHPYHVDI